MTISEMAKELNIPKDTVKMRLNRAGVKPFCQEALYTRADFERIKNIKMGRPKKPETKTVSKAKPAKDKAPEKPAKKK